MVLQVKDEPVDYIEPEDPPEDTIDNDSLGSEPGLVDDGEIVDPSDPDFTPGMCALSNKY
mgnify:CR=1 FL=1